MTLPASRDWLFPVKTFIASMLALFIGLKLRLPRLARAVDDQRNLTARMLDRLMRIITRLAATDDKRHPSVERFRDLHIAFNALDLQRLSRRLGRDRRLVGDSRLVGTAGSAGTAGSSGTNRPRSKPCSTACADTSSIARGIARASRCRRASAPPSISRSNGSCGAARRWPPRAYRPCCLKAATS